MTPGPDLEAARPILEWLARVRPLRVVRDVGEAPKSGVASTVLAQAQVVVPLAGLIDLVRKGYFSKGERVLFLHTGGSPALYHYKDVILERK